MKIRRRNFIQSGLGVAAALSSRGIGVATPGSWPGAGHASQSAVASSVNNGWKIALFTDFVDDLEYGFTYQDVARLIQPLGIAGPDLTLRPGGLVAPERVVEELPKAAAVFQDHGLSIPVIATAITSIEDPDTQPVLQTAAKLGIPYFRLGYYPYQNPTRWKAELEATRKKLEHLVAAARWEGIHAIFHNHSGPTIGAGMWDLWELIEPLDPDWISAYFDPSHATIEGGKNGWMLGFYRLAPRIRTIAVKDFYWEKVSGRWRTRWCPMGKGMVDWPRFFKMLAEVSFRGMISISIEYDPGGASKRERFERSLAAAEQDVKFVTEHLKKAFA